MNQQRIQQIAHSLATVDSRDSAAQAALLGDLALLRNEFEAQGDTVRANCAQATTQLLQYLTQLGCIGPEGILKVVKTLVTGLGAEAGSELELAQPAAAEDEQTVRERAAQVALRPAPVAAPPRAPLPAFRDIELDLGNSRTDLRMLSDCLLGEVMIQMGIIQREALERALEVQGATGMRIGEALVDVGAATWDQIQDALRQQEDQKQA